MSDDLFKKAKTCFTENLSEIDSQSKNRNELLLWNLNAGLSNLTDAVQQELVNSTCA